MLKRVPWPLIIGLLVMIEVAILLSFGTLKSCSIARIKVERNSFGLATLPDTLSQWQCVKVAVH